MSKRSDLQSHSGIWVGGLSLPPLTCGSISGSKVTPFPSLRQWGGENERKEGIMESSSFLTTHFSHSQPTGQNLVWDHTLAAREAGKFSLQLDSQVPRYNSHMGKWRKCGGLLIKKKRKVDVGGLVCNIVVYSIDILVTQMPKIHFSYIFNLHPWFLGHNSQNPSNVLSYKSNGNIFGNTWSLVFFLKLPLSHKGEMGSCYS